jgi:hypothetical protein
VPELRLTPARRQWFVRAGLLLSVCLWSAFGLAGLALAPLHPDESMQIYASRDFDRLLAEGVGSLTTRPPYPVDSDEHLRILNGSIHRHLVGWFRRLAGLPPDLLPPAPGWDWRLDAGDNIARGSLPPPGVLLVGRLASAAFLPMVALAAAAIGAATVGGRWTLAYLALLMLNPVLLLHTRRAMQEGSLLGLGLVAVWAALAVGRCLAGGREPRLWRWSLLGFACGLTVAAKHSGLLFVLAAACLVSAGWIFGPRKDFRPLIHASASAAAAVALFLVLQPSLWSNPPERLKDLLALRSAMLAAQSQDAAPAAGAAFRLTAMPFALPLQFHETGEVADHPLFARWSRVYADQWMAGLPMAGAMVWSLALLSAVGLWFSLRGWTARGETGYLQAFPAIWWIAVALPLLLSPLPWQRYFLPLLPAALLLAVAGAKALTALVGRLRSAEAVAGPSL